jgi:hypothetical protein
VDDDLQAWLAAIVFDSFSREHGSGESYVEPTRARQCQLSWFV